MEPNNQPQPLDKTNVPAVPAPEPAAVAPIPAFDLSALATPPKANTMEQAFVPPPPIGIPVVAAAPAVPAVPIAEQVSQLEKDIVLS